MASSAENSRVIDFRVRPPYKQFLGHHNFTSVGQGVFRLGMHGPGSPSLTSVAGFLAEMDAAGIESGVIFGSQTRHGTDPPIPNSTVEELVHQFPNRFQGIGGIDPSHVEDAVKEVTSCARLGMRGVVLLNPWADPVRYDDDEAVMPIYEACRDHRLILVLVASGFVGPNLSYSNPTHIENVAAAFPTLRIVMSHGGWPWVNEACAVTMKHQNVYLLPDIYLNTPNIPGRDSYVSYINLVEGERVLFGSGFPIMGMAASVTECRSLPISPRAMQRLMRDTAAQLLEL